MPVIKSVMALDGFRIAALFSDNEVKIYDMHRLLPKLPQFDELLKDETLFFKVHKSPGGYGVIWDDYFELAAEEIYANGTSVIL